MHVNTLILGAGAAGLMAAAHCGPDTLVVDHAKSPGEKIRISGGGRCNFTNLYAGPESFLSENKHFCKSALSRYTQWDFIDLVNKHQIPWHEKTLGQLFCDTSAKDIIQMLLNELRPAKLWVRTEIKAVTKTNTGFSVHLNVDEQTIDVTCKNLIVATGGKSIPKMGATGLAYDIAQQFGHRITDLRPALVPFTFPDGRFKPLAGVATPVRATAGTQPFEEALLFTHRGLSGPAVLQASSYWREGETVEIDFSPHADLTTVLKEARHAQGRQNLSTTLSGILPSKFVNYASENIDLKGNTGDLSDKRIAGIAELLHHWHIVPQGTEGYRTAEVTLGGVSTDEIDSRTMMSKRQQGLYFIGECVDVTGWLGGYNFQWAWSSAVAAGRAIQAV